MAEERSRITAQPEIYSDAWYDQHLVAQRWYVQPWSRCLIFMVRLYQWTLRPWMGYACRFQPTCSTYAIHALKRYGPIRGTALAVRRVSRCHPLGGGGWDPA